MNNYQKCCQFESKTLKYFTDILTTQIYPESYKKYNQTDHNSKPIDQEVSMDVFLEKDEYPTLSAQIKCRRFEHYKYFLNKKDLLLNICKITTCGKFYPGDYIKCQADLFMYGFANHQDENQISGLAYWAVIHYPRLKNKFIRVGGYKRIPGVQIKQHHEGRITTNFMIIPWAFVSDCLIKTSN